MTRAERLSRTSPRYAYASPELPVYRPGPGRNPAAPPAVAVPGESSPVALGLSGLTVRTLYTYIALVSRGKSVWSVIALRFIDRYRLDRRRDTCPGRDRRQSGDHVAKPVQTLHLTIDGHRP